MLSCGDAKEEYIEDSIVRKQVYSKCLRLLCLRTLTNDIKQKQYDHFKREILHVQFNFFLLLISSRMDMNKCSLLVTWKHAVY